MDTNYNETITEIEEIELESEYESFDEYISKKLKNESKDILDYVNRSDKRLSRMEQVYKGLIGNNNADILKDFGIDKFDMHKHLTMEFLRLKLGAQANIFMKKFIRKIMIHAYNYVTDIEIQTKLNKQHKFLLIRPTGFGKTYYAASLTEHYYKSNNNIKGTVAFV